MELHNKRLDNDPARRFPAGSLRRDLEPTVKRVATGRVLRQEQVKQLTEQLRTHREKGSDSIDLSQTARMVRDDASQTERATLVDGLRAAYKNGNLNTRERIERAAHNLLAGE